MKKEMKKVPVVRFKGFTSDWEQRKLSELAIFSKGIGYSKSDLRESGTPIILYGRLYTKYETVIKDVDTFVEDKTDSIYSKGGEVIVPASGETAEDISIASVVEKPGILLGSDLNIIHPNKKIDSTFLAISISNGEPHLDMARRAQGKSIVHLHNDDLAQIGLSYPILEEQRKISRCFSQLDHLLTLHRQKLDQLKKLKAYFLQNLFPAKGEKVPKIRFKGFTGEWEQSKLGNVLIERSILRKQSDEFPLVSFTVKNGVTPKTERYEREQLVVGDKKEKSYKETRLNDIVHNPANLKFGAIARNKYGNAVFSPIYVTYDVREEMALPSFVERFVTRESFIKNALRYQQGTVYERMAVSPNDFETLDILVPTKDEQKKIGDVFDNLDTLITLYQYNLECFQAVKKFLLQNLFV